MIIDLLREQKNAKIPGGSYRLWAENKMIAEEYLAHGFRVVMLAGKNLLFQPEGQSMPLSETEYQKLLDARSHDVFLISENGKMMRVFEAMSGDNTLMVTGLCNSNCIMCPAHDNLRKNADSLSLPSALERILYMPEDTPHITITGGEPFMVRENLFPMLEALKEHLPNTDFLLLTNGRALAYEPYFKRYCETVPQNTLIGIPVHGHDSNTHDRITRAAGSFEQTKKAVKKLIHAGFPVELRLVISKLNEDDIEEIGNLICREFQGVHTVKFMGLEMLGNAAVHHDQVWIPYREAFLKSKAAIDHLIQQQIDVGLYNFPLCAVDEKYHTLCRKSISGYKVRYPEACNRCVKKDACGGIFSGSMRMAAEAVVPWE